MSALAEPQVTLPAPLRPAVVPSTGVPLEQVDATGIAPLRPDTLVRRGTRSQLQLVADALCAAVALVVTTLTTSAAWGSAPVASSLVLGGALTLSWLLLVALNHGYESRPFPIGAEDLGRVSRAGVELAVVGAALAWTLDASLPRTELLALVAVTTGLSLGHRVLGSGRERWLRARGVTAPRRVVVVGHPQQADLVAAELARSRTSGFEVAGLCLPETDDVATERPDGVPVTAGLDQLAALVRQQEAEAVVVLPCDHLTPQVLRRAAWDLEGADAQLFVAPGVLDVDHGRSRIAHAGGLPMMHIRPAELRGGRHLAKSVTERTLALLALLVLSPVLLALLVAIRVDSPGSPLFRQRRIGRDGVPFTMLKLRTMSAGADRQVTQLADVNESDGVLFKLRADPRITRLGKVLRRYSVDELPQLVNVVRGDMSLVGPRPALPDEVARYESDVHRRLAVRPGVTGLWQVSGRSDLSWEESVRLDLAYVDNWSPWSDVKILLRTGRAVFSHTGAY